jgi:hypothetical protein
MGLILPLWTHGQRLALRLRKLACAQSATTKGGGFSAAGACASHPVAPLVTEPTLLMLPSAPVDWPRMLLPLCTAPVVAASSHTLSPLVSDSAERF